MRSSAWIPTRCSRRPMCFAGARVPVQTFLDYLVEGGTLHTFLADFPTM